MVDGTRWIAAALVAVAAGGGTARARTTTVAGGASEQVSVADLDLSSATGREAAQGRLLAAARAVCDAVGADAADQAVQNRCEDEALEPARRELARLAAVDAPPGRR